MCATGLVSLVAHLRPLSFRTFRPALIRRFVRGQSPIPPAPPDYLRKHRPNEGEPAPSQKNLRIRAYDQKGDR